MTTASSRDLDSLRRAASRGLIALIWLHVPLIAGIALWRGGAAMAEGLTALGLAAAATATWRMRGEVLATRLTVAVALVGMVALLLQAMAGHPWQLDLHMYFFAALAVLSVYCDWRVLIAAAGATALHHLALNLLLPAAVYPDGADLGRVVLHAVIVVLETAVLAWLAAQLVGLFALSARSIAAADAARAAETEAHAREIAGETEARAARRRTADELAERFEGSVDHLVRQAAETAARVRHASQDLSNAASDTAQRTAALSAASQETADDVRSVAAAAGTLSSSVREIGGHMAQAAEIADRATGEAGQTDRTVRSLAEAAQRIEQIVTLIGTIAEQTNLLALNATIEASRAGAAGRGFAVVAGEVKALAEKTARATQDIEAQIRAIQDQTDQAVAAIARIGGTIGELDVITRSVADAVEGQGAATRAIAENAERAARRSGEVFSTLDGLTRSADLTGTAAASGLDASSRLAGECETLADTVRRFVATLRAA
ncbi:methyl-accepting chemotaxis protein [Methylorubrum salsuginis]|uniref:Methyl-accepting chemotaxis protein n=1 Tax=Methylorubrum salsuginis TaxID=414703 RepID=A0A1I4FGL2_9HYPH|nr:methyl-accepting chemotaxis protein [Methylorubrum salsuginis]SFL17062.1 methyl-accepting chemotaxis protein [Methylorubrum salsuginis]